MNLCANNKDINDKTPSIADDGSTAFSFADSAMQPLSCYSHHPVRYNYINNNKLTDLTLNKQLRLTFLFPPLTSLFLLLIASY
jgi:hypothetical protein